MTKQKALKTCWFVFSDNDLPLLAYFVFANNYPVLSIYIAALQIIFPVFSCLSGKFAERSSLQTANSTTQPEANLEPVQVRPGTPQFRGLWPYLIRTETLICGRLCRIWAFVSVALFQRPVHGYMCEVKWGSRAAFSALASQLAEDLFF